MQDNKLTYWLAIAAIVFVAFFLRIYNIDNIPAGIYPDEAVNGTDALAAAETGNYQWFYINNNGREGLFLNLIAIATKVFGPTALALKFWSIVFGTLTVFGVFLLTRELFRNHLTAIVAAYLTAFSFWSINFSRIAFRAIMLPAILVFSFYFFWKGIRTKKYCYFIFSGLIFGLGFHTYIAWRIAPLIIITAAIILFMSRSHFIKNYWKYALIFIFSSLITMLPLLLYFKIYPQYFSSRSGSISIFSPEINQGHFWKTLITSFALSIGKFSFFGDMNWRHNFPPYPLLNPLIAIAFLFSLAKLPVKSMIFLKSFFTKNRIFLKANEPYVFVFAWFLIMLTPEFLTGEGLPHALRSIGALPAVYIMSSLPIVRLFKEAKEKGKKYIQILIIVGLIFVGIFNTVKYFHIWADKPQQHSAFDASLKNMAVYLNTLPKDLPKYLIPEASEESLRYGLPIQAEVIKYLTYKKTDNITFTKETDNFQTPSVIILMSYDENYINAVKKNFPGASIEKIDLNPNHRSDFTVIQLK